MPISSKTISELKETTAQFDFLLSAPNVKIKAIPPDHRLCVICLEPFENTAAWTVGAPVNRPVKLECGHMFGTTCLARLVFDSDFGNRCPLCRAPVIPAPVARNPSGQSWKAAVPLLRVLMMFGGDRAAFSKHKALDVLQRGVEREGPVAPPAAGAGKHMHRIMVLYEEFLSQFCDRPPPVEDAERLVVAEARVEELQDALSELVDLRRQIDEAQAARARREEAARAERERELEDVKGELEAVRQRWEEARGALEGSEKELEEARNGGRVAGRELEGFGEEAKKAATELERMQKRLEGAEKKLKAMASSIGVFFLVGMTTTAVLAHFEGHLFDRSTSSMAILGMWIVHCVLAVVRIAVFRSRPSRKSWKIFGLVVCCGLLGVGLERERFAL